MEVLTFKYTDAKNKVTVRTLVTLASPHTMYAGIDISELEPTDRVLYAEAAKKLKEKYTQEMAQLTADFDLNYRYRHFKPENMANIIVETI